MLMRHWQIWTIRVRQLGLWRALCLNLLKLLRKLLLPGTQFHFGMTAEDIVLQFLAEKYLGRRAFTYVDIGCHEPRRISNSYLLYLNGSSGLAIDLDPRYATEFKRERPNDIFVCAAVSDSPGQATVHEFRTAEVNTIDPLQAQLWKDQFQHQGSRTVETATLSALMTRHMPNRTVDLLLIDVEGHELAVLQGANLGALRPAIVVCELHGLKLSSYATNPVVGFLDQAGYGLVSYATVNGYFVRRDLLDGDVAST
jgi:FkbM family methyltransferase